MWVQVIIFFERNVAAVKFKGPDFLWMKRKTLIKMKLIRKLENPIHTFRDTNLVV